MMRKMFLLANCLALVGAFGAWFYVAWIASLGGPGRVTQLDRNEVLNLAKLREYSPYLADNVRYNVGNWIQEPVRSTAILYAQCLAGLALLNIVGHYMMGLKKTTGQQGAAPRLPAPTELAESAR